VVERLLQPVVRVLGWRTDFPWERFGRWIGQRADLHLVERRAMPPFGHFSLIRVRKAEAPARQPAPGIA
jgi:phosphatidylethanolamine/phosphatidyl-N-methylethanolamine N-methyltransferase